MRVNEDFLKLLACFAALLIVVYIWLTAYDYGTPLLACTGIMAVILTLFATAKRGWAAMSTRQRIRTCIVIIIAGVIFVIASAAILWWLVDGIGEALVGM